MRKIRRDSLNHDEPLRNALTAIFQCLTLDRNYEEPTQCPPLTPLENMFWKQL